MLALKPPIVYEGATKRAGAKIILFGKSIESMERFVVNFNNIDIENKINGEILSIISARKKRPALEAFKSRARARMTLSDFD